MRKIPFFVQNRLKFLLISMLFLQGCSNDYNESHSSFLNRKESGHDSTAEAINELGMSREALVHQSLMNFSDVTLPHQAKELRKQIVRLRDILDIFAHHFAHQMALWSEVRKGLDAGYFFVGEYKDLFDTNPTAKNEVKNGQVPSYPNVVKVRERRDKVLAWKKNYFSEKGLRKKITELLSQVKKLESDDISNSKRYSKFFWGGLDKTPSHDGGPDETARTLAEAQSKIAHVEHRNFLDLLDPSTHENEIIFHDHRKRLRTISKVCQVGNHFKQETCNSTALAQIDELVSELGEIEDLIVTGRFLENDGKPTEAIESYKMAKLKFEKLKSSYQGRHMLDALNSL